jgi:hypothetical protein
VDNAFWQSIKENSFAVPTGFSVEALTPELLSYLGSPDPELRDGFAYRILSEWIDGGVYAHAGLWAMATQMFHNLAIGLGGQQNDTVLMRSYSVLILMEMMYHDVKTSPTFSEAEARTVLDRVLRYFLAENDLRGYVPEKEWIHAIAHSSDCFFLLAQHPVMTASDLERIMDALATKITAPVPHIYLYDEDERLARAVMGVLQRNLLTLPFLAHWLERVTRPAERVAWSDGQECAQSKPETCARHNSKHFLRSVYFQLRAPGFADLTHVEQRPAITDELLPMVEHALAQIHTWC